MLVAEGKAAQVVFCVGGIDRYDEKILKLERDDPPLLVGVPVPVAGHVVFLEYLLRQTEQYGQRLLFRENSCSAVAFARRRGIPVFLVFGKVDLGLVLLCLGLLEARNIRFHRLKEGHKRPFLVYAPDAVDVPRDEFHANIIRREYRKTKGCRPSSSMYETSDQ